MMPAHLDASLISQLHQVQFEHVRARMEVMREVRGDPGATRYFEAEHVRACAAPGVPNPFFNQVFISGPPEPRALESVFAFFEECGMTPRFELGPGAISSELAQQLSSRGFLHTQSDPILMQSGSALLPRSGSAIQIDRVPAAREIDVFESAYVRAWQVEAWLAPTLGSYVRRWPSVPGWSLYLASQDAVPVGVALLSESGNVAYLADAATLPESRGQGVQSALIAQRIADAGRNSAALVFSRAAFGTSSQRNLERAGLVSRYTVSIWTRHRS